MVCQKFDEALLNAVDFAFCSLGKSCQQTLYFHLKTSFHIERAEIPNELEEFDNALKLIFKSGAVFLEKLILEKLCEELGVKFGKKHGSNFIEAIFGIRRMALEKESLLMVSSFLEEITVVKRKHGGGKREA